MLSLVNRCIENKRPEIFNLTFNGDSYRIQGHEGNAPENEEFHYEWAISFCSKEGDLPPLYCFLVNGQIIHHIYITSLQQVQSMGLTCQRFTNALSH